LVKLRGRGLHSKNHRFLGRHTCFGFETKGGDVFRLSKSSFKRSRRELSIGVVEHTSTSKNKGVVRILVIFQDRPMFSHISQKVLARAFHWCG